MEPIEFYINNNSEDVKGVTMAMIEDVVCKEYGLLHEDLHSKSRVGMLPTGRFMCYYFARKYELFSSIERLGSHFNQHHSNVLHGLKAVSNSIETDYYHRKRFNIIKRRLNKIH